MLLIEWADNADGGIGATKRGKGMKIMAIFDRHGLLLSASTHAASHHEVRLVQLCFDFYMIEAKPKNLIGDRAYDRDPLDEEVALFRLDPVAARNPRPLGVPDPEFPGLCSARLRSSETEPIVNNSPK